MAVVLLDRAVDLRVAGEPQLDLEVALEVGAQLVDRDDVVGVGERDDELLRLAVERHREHAVAARHVARHRLERRRIDDDVRQVDRLQPELLGQRVAQRRFRHEAELHQQAPDRARCDFVCSSSAMRSWSSVRIPWSIRIWPMWRLACGLAGEFIQIA